MTIRSVRKPSNSGITSLVTTRHHEWLRGAVRESLDRCLDSRRTARLIQIKRNLKIEARFARSAEHWERSSLHYAGILGIGVNLIPLYHLLRMKKHIYELLGLFQRLFWGMAFQSSVQVLPRLDLLSLFGHWADHESLAIGHMPITPALLQRSLAIVRDSRCGRVVGKLSEDVTRSAEDEQRVFQIVRIWSEIADRFNIDVTLISRSLEDSVEGLSGRLSDSFKRMLEARDEPRRWVLEDALDDLSDRLAAKIGRRMLLVALLGFLPIVGPLVSFWIDYSILRSFLVVAKQHYGRVLT